MYKFWCNQDVLYNLKHHSWESEVEVTGSVILSFLYYKCGHGVSLVIALLYSLCIHTIGLRICVHNFLSDLVTACNKSRQKTRVTNFLSKALQDNMHEMIDNNNEDNPKKRWFIRHR